MSDAKNRTFQYDAVFSLSKHSHSLTELDFCLTPPLGSLCYVSSTGYCQIQDLTRVTYAQCRI
jgi:hypothetical protein